MNCSQAGRKGGLSRSVAKKASSSQNLAKARGARSERAALPFPTRWLMDIITRSPKPKLPGFPAVDILELPPKLDEKQIDTLRRAWAAEQGGENQFKMAVLEQAAKYEKA